MLSTLLEIGRKFRESPEGLKHHRYIKAAPQPDLDPKNRNAIGNSTEFFRVPVNPDGSFDFAQREPFDNENLIGKLFYLEYKTADRFDTYKKYIFGDVFRVVDKKTQKDSGGNFLKGNPQVTGFYSQNSFLRGKDDAASISNELIKNFRESFYNQMEDIISHLEATPNCYIHFDFNGGMWWEQEEPMRVLNEKMLSEIVTSHDETGKFVLTKPIYKTLIPTMEGKVPGLLPKNSYKCRLFDSLDEVMDLLYALDFSTKAIIRKGDVKVIVLPRGEELSAEQIERFFVRQNFGTQAPGQKAGEVRAAVKSAQEMIAVEEADDLFAPTIQNVPESIAQFDFVFSKAGSASAPDIDMLEIPSLERSLLESLSARVVQIRREVETDRPKSAKILPLSITQSFLNILGDSTRAKKKYQNHLFKVLPQIYTGTYYRDDVLLPAFIEKTEFNIRNESTNFGLMKFDFYFLTKLLNCKEDRLMEIQSSPSYRVGMLLGKLARQFAGPKSPIKSFEKNYVGLLSRRITSLPEVVRLGNEINQKLVMHELAKFTFRDSHEFAEAIKGFEGTYNKDECAFGFFESYFAPIASKKDGNENPDSEQDADEVAPDETTAEQLQLTA